MGGMKAMKASKMHHRKNYRRIREYLVWRRKDLEGHSNCLKIFVGLDIVYITPEGVIQKNGIMLIKANDHVDKSQFEFLFWNKHYARCFIRCTSNPHNDTTESALLSLF